jgi:hypothetical protein
MDGPDALLLEAAACGTTMPSPRPSLDEAATAWAFPAAASDVSAPAAPWLMKSDIDIDTPALAEVAVLSKA